MRRILTFLTFVAGLLSFAAGANAATITTVPLAWNPSTSKNVAGYEIYYGTSSGNYTTAVPVSNVTNITIRGLVTGTKYYFAASSYDNSGNVSSYSQEISTIAGVTNAATTNAATTNTPVTLTPSAALSKTGQYGFAVAGLAGSNYLVQASTDLVHWVTLQTNISPFNFVDSNASQFRQRFYRTAFLH